MQPPGDDEEDRAIPVGQHPVVDVGGAAEVAAGEAHLLHRVDDRPRVEAGDVDMLDHCGEQFRLAIVVAGRLVHSNFLFIAEAPPEPKPLRS
jgi:hypothetical protein